MTKMKKKIKLLIKDYASGLLHNISLLLAENLSFWHKICNFVQNLPFCSVKDLSLSLLFFSLFVFAIFCSPVLELEGERCISKRKVNKIGKTGNTHELSPDTGDQCSQLVAATLVTSTPYMLIFQYNEIAM